MVKRSLGNKKYVNISCLAFEQKKKLRDSCWKAIPGFNILSFKSCSNFVLCDESLILTLLLGKVLSWHFRGCWISLFLKSINSGKVNNLFSRTDWCFECDYDWRVWIGFLCASFCSTSLNTVYTDLTWYHQCLTNFWIGMSKCKLPSSSCGRAQSSLCSLKRSTHLSLWVVAAVGAIAKRFCFLFFTLELMAFTQKRCSVVLWHLILLLSCTADVQAFQALRNIWEQWSRAAFYLHEEKSVLLLV